MVFSGWVSFWPRDEVLVGYFLHRRNGGLPMDILPGTIYEEDVYATEPWNLPSECFAYGEHKNQGFFFTPRHPAITSSSHRRRGGGVRARRTAGSGTWHGQGHLTPVHCSDQSGIPAGHKTTLTFKRSDGTMTDWLMQEYLLNLPDDRFQAIALCRIYKKHRAAATGRKRSSSSPAISCQQPSDDRHLLDSMTTSSMHPNYPNKRARNPAEPPHPSMPSPPDFHDQQHLLFSDDDNDAGVSADISSSPLEHPPAYTCDEPLTVED